MSKRLPKKIFVAPDQTVSVIEKKMKDCLGCCNLRKEVIYINSDQHPVGKHCILFHEMIHIAAEKLKMSGLVKRQPSEEFVTNLTGTLFLMLALSGLWNGVTPKEARELLEYEEAEKNE